MTMRLLMLSGWCLMVLMAGCSPTITEEGSAFVIGNAKSKIEQVSHEQNRTLQLVSLNERFRDTLSSKPGITGVSCVFHALTMEIDSIDLDRKHHHSTRDTTEFFVVLSTRQCGRFDEAKVEAVVRDCLRASGFSVEGMFKPTQLKHEWAITGYGVVVRGNRGQGNREIGRK